MYSNTFVYTVSIFMLQGEYFFSPNQTLPPEPFVKVKPVLLPRHSNQNEKLTIVDGYPYLGFCDKSPFQGLLLASLVDIQHDRFGWHLSHKTAKSWKGLKHVLCCIAKLLTFCTKSTCSYFFCLFFIDPPLPSQCGYFSAHSTEDIAGLHIRSSLDAFAVFFAYVSFFVTVSQFTGQETETPTWRILITNRM